jgi:hypothetical protein
MPVSPQKHIANAVASLAKAQEAMAVQIARHDKIIASQGHDIAVLEQKVQDLRNCAIKADLAAGLSGREVAEKYDLSPGRVSQIKNS